VNTIDPCETPILTSSVEPSYTYTLTASAKVITWTEFTVDPSLCSIGYTATIPSDAAGIMTFSETSKTLTIEGSDSKYIGIYTVIIHGKTPNGATADNGSVSITVEVRQSSVTADARSTTAAIVGVSVAAGSVAKHMASGGTLTKAGQPSRGFHKTRPFAVAGETRGYVPNTAAGRRSATGGTAAGFDSFETTGGSNNRVNEPNFDTSQFERAEGGFEGTDVVNDFADGADSFDFGLPVDNMGMLGVY
jgi:hypothetical protein